MGCGASAATEQHKALAQHRGELREQRSKLEAMDKKLQGATDVLVRAADFRQSKDVFVRDSLLEELKVEKLEHARKLAALQERLHAEHQGALRNHHEDVAADAEAREALAQQVESFSEHCAILQEAHRVNLEEVEERSREARAELLAIQSEYCDASRDRDAEFKELSRQREELLSTKRASLKHDQERVAEMKKRLVEAEALAVGQKDREDEAKALQQELNRTSYAVGQRDRELQLKNSELQEVRQSLVAIQDQMDDVNKQLHEQCSRVQRIEGSMQHSQDRQEKVQAMRGMLQESHGALAQIRRLLEHEREQRQQCGKSLKQQKVRTEMLLQLLHHFKNRTQDIAPSALLGPAAELLQDGLAGAEASPTRELVYERQRVGP
eukprot:gnl/TRDRNA2_/TRDRNA2_177686_c3_seq1.p1 gnl/TRDRNA2_/TRDRNA2_177686_c3~~gnl/TRDRNA2_/TRDRNA2_177686_c3_seq1.p1  ORF type:complete len:403 (+),score=114.73 gnl/TRDRNA2_/TRDRNA2_177686_c3_seq1:67-1209(+)